MGFDIGRLTRLPLGYQGENNSRTIQVCVSEWLAEWPNASVEVMVQRPGEDTFYPANTEVTNGVLTWIPNRSDVQFAGEGIAQFILTDDNDVELRSRVVKTIIEQSIDGTQGEPTAPGDSWVHDVFQAAEDAREAVDKMPIIGENGNWFVWDAESSEHVDSGVPAKGKDGEDGKPATVRIGTVTTLEPGSKATVSNSGTETDAVLNFGLPRGADATGAQGGHYIPKAEQTNSTTMHMSFTPSDESMPSVSPVDIALPQGPKGEDGKAATLRIGTVTTLEPGSEATVNNSGTEKDAVLNFGIPGGGSGTGTVTSVNGVEPDGNGNVVIPIPSKPGDIGAEVSGTATAKVSAHNEDEQSHPDIRELISGLSQRLNGIADSDDTTLDQLSEIVAYIKSNKSLIDNITTGKVSVSDIVNNLTSTATNKPLSAAQGKALKALIDAIVVPTKVSQLTNDAGYLTEHQDISGKLDANRLPEAINTALEQAKDSGEFDGEPGSSGVHVGADTPAGDEVVWLDPTGTPSNTETWEFTLSDGSIVTKTVVIV